MLYSPMLPTGWASRAPDEPEKPDDAKSRQLAVFRQPSLPLILMRTLAAFGMGLMFTVTQDIAGVHSSFAAAIIGLMFFWAIAIALTFFALWLPLVCVEISLDGVYVRERAPTWERDRVFAAKDVSVSSVAKHDLGDGGFVYSCSLVLPVTDDALRSRRTFRSRLPWFRTDPELITLSTGFSPRKAESVRVQAIEALRTANRQAGTPSPSVR
jgi:hypothetical protein